MSAMLRSFQFVHAAIGRRATASITPTTPPSAHARQMWIFAAISMASSISDAEARTVLAQIASPMAGFRSH